LKSDDIVRSALYEQRRKEKARERERERERERGHMPISVLAREFSSFVFLGFILVTIRDIFRQENLSSFFA